MCQKRLSNITSHLIILHIHSSITLVAFHVLGEKKKYDSQSPNLTKVTPLSYLQSEEMNKSILGSVVSLQNDVRRFSIIRCNLPKGAEHFYFCNKSSMWHAVCVVYSGQKFFVFFKKRKKGK